MTRKKSASPAPSAIPPAAPRAGLDSPARRPDIYASNKSRLVTLVGGLDLHSVSIFQVDGEEVDFSPIFLHFTEFEVESLIFGAQLGDLLARLMHRRERFNVLIPRALMASVREAAELVGRPCLVWECGDNEDPEGNYARAEFAPTGGLVTAERIEADRVPDPKTV